MSAVPPAAPPLADAVHRPAVYLAAAGSAAAGLVHAAAAGSHADLGTLSMLFAEAAIAQILWAAAILLRPSRPLLVVGALLQGAAITAWLVSRTVGVDFIEGLEGGQAAGLQDTLTVGLEVVTLVAIGLAASRRAVFTNPAWTGAAAGMAVALLLAAVPAMATPHAHDHGDTTAVAAGADGHSHGTTETVASDETATGDGHSHDETPPAVTMTDEQLGYPATFLSWLDEADVTEAQRDAAEDLLVRTNAAVEEQFPDEQSLKDAGYVSIGDGSTGWEHYVHVSRIANSTVLDPNEIESIVLQVNPDGTKQVASAMYLLPFGSSMDDVPDIAGGLTVWHDHQNLCWEGVRVVGTTDATGSCVRGEFRGTQPMMHVWVQDHECGPFAGIEGSHGAGCDHGH